jgi:hypothetical protein
MSDEKPKAEKEKIADPIGVSKAALAKEAMKRRAQDILRSSAQGRVSGTLREINSKDAPTRYMARVFVLSLVAMGLVFYGAFHLYRQSHPAAKTEPNNLGLFLAKEVQNDKINWAELDLGNFTIEVKQDPNAPKPARGVMNMAAIQLILECDGEETRSYIADHQVPARNKIIDILSPIDREYIVTKEGREKLKKLLLSGLNMWLPRGKVVEIYFPKLLIN